MIEYIYDCIRATAGEDITITANITDANGTQIISDCSLKFTAGDTIIIADGVCDEEGIWMFTIPANYTEGLKGRYWYEILCGEASVSFAEPIYLV